MSDIVNELSSAEPLERMAAAFNSCHSRQQMVARVPSATITMAREGPERIFTFRCTRVNHVQIYPLIVSFPGPTGQHTVLLTRWLGVASFALDFLTFCDAYAPEIPLY